MTLSLPINLATGTTWCHLMQVDSRSADARTMKIHEETTFNEGLGYQVGIFWADEESMLPNNYFPALVQPKSLERRLGKDSQLNEIYSETIRKDSNKRYVDRVDMSKCFLIDNRHEWYLPHLPVLHPNNPGKVRRVLNCAAMFHGYSLNSALLTGPDPVQSLIHLFFQIPPIPPNPQGLVLKVGLIPKNQPFFRFFSWQ